MSNATKRLAQPGARIVHAIGRITITLTYVRDNAYTVTTEQGGTYRIQELCTAHRDEQAARSRARLIAAALKDGVSVEQLIGSVQAAQADVLAAADAILDNALAVAVADPRTVAAEPTIRAMQAAKADDSDELAARIRADLDQQEADRRNRQADLNADVAAIMANSAGFRSLRQEVRQVRPTLAGAHLADITDPQTRALNARDEQGRIFPGAGITRPTLKAMARKGLGRLVYGGNSRYAIDHLVLNARGMAEAAAA